MNNICNILIFCVLLISCKPKLSKLKATDQIKLDFPELNQGYVTFDFLDENLRNATRDEIYNNVYSIRISGVTYKKMPKAILKFRNLEELEFLNSEVDSIQSWIGEIKKLNKFKLYDCKVKSIPKELGKLLNLRQLILFRSNLKNIPMEIGNLQQLEELKISTNPIKKFHDEWGNLSNLRRLEMAACNLEEVPNFVFELSKLEYLRIGENEFKSIPNNISKLKNLYEINCTFSELSKMEKLKIKELLPNTKVVFEH